MWYFYIPVGRQHLSTRLVSQWHCQCVESLTLTKTSSRLEPGSFFRWLWQEYSGPPEPEKNLRVIIFEIFIFEIYIFSIFLYLHLLEATTRYQLVDFALTTTIQ